MTRVEGAGPRLPWRRRWRRRGYHLFARLLLATARTVPLPVGRAAGAGLGALALRLRPRERARARANLALALPELDAGAREALLKRAAAALGANLHDALALERLASGGYAGVDGTAAAAAAHALLAEGRGLLILTGHLGCWELLGGWLARELGGLAVVTGTIHNAPVDRLVNGRRRRLGLTPLPRGGDLRPLLRVLRSGGAVAVLLDQNAPVANLPFFGRPAPTAAGFARLALRTGAPVLPLAIRRRGTGHFVEQLPPLRPRGGTDEGAVYSCLAWCNAALETLIRRAPTEWVWFHARWPEPGEEGQGT
ncbi:MAG: lysophospholipid acyltransferase family protein [Candidatus Krumholzibacteriia bacterium]